MPPTFRVLPHALTCALAIAVALGTPLSALAQQQLGAIQGTVTDESGAVVPGVTITVTNITTGVARPTVSNESGVYRVPSLDPGQYEATAALESFRTVHRRDITVSVGAVVGLNFQMQTGQVTESIEVRGNAPDIQTQKADVSAVSSRRSSRTCRWSAAIRSRWRRCSPASWAFPRRPTSS